MSLLERLISCDCCVSVVVEYAHIVSAILEEVEGHEQKQEV